MNEDVKGDVLILGAGRRQRHEFDRPDCRPVTIDINPDNEPDIVRDLATPQLPFPDDSFDFIVADQILEHLGMQGDFRLFFDQFSEYWRVLRPDGQLRAGVPRSDSLWAWGDPSHTRIINEGTIAFLNQPTYTRDIGKTTMSDFRHWYRADFDVLAASKDEHHFYFHLKAVKPSRIMFR